MNKALQTFESIFARADDMLFGSQVILELFRKQKGNNPDLDHTVLNPSGDMVRAAIVLAVAAMDDYFTRKYAEVFVRSIKRRGITTALCGILANSGLDTKASLELLTMPRPYGRIKALATKQFSTYSAQNTKQIDYLFSTLGLMDLSKHAERMAHRRSLLTSVTSLVKRRHVIAHCGDLNRRGKTLPINYKGTVRHFKDLAVFVKNCDTIISNHIKG